MRAPFFRNGNQMGYPLIVSRPLQETTLLRHFGIYFPRQNRILENTKNAKPQYVSVDEFSKGLPIRTDAIVEDHPLSVEARARAIHLEQSKWTLLNNCEHLASYVATGVHRSKQLETALVGTALGILLILLSEA